MLVALLAAAVMACPFIAADSSAASGTHGGAQAQTDFMSVTYKEVAGSDIPYQLIITVFTPPAEDASISMVSSSGDTIHLSPVPFSGRDLHIALSEPLLREEYLLVVDTVSYIPIDQCSLTVYDYCILSFSAGKGSGSMDSIEVRTGVDFQMPKCGFTAPEGMDFDTWKVGSSTYKEGQTISLSADATATAQWSSTPGPAPEPSSGGLGWEVIVAIVALIAVLIVVVIIILRRPSI